jgi:hypothetical protein
MTIDPKKEFVAKRRGRNIALALALVAFIGLVYAITLVRLGAGS